jgi:hypothetical protein
LADAVAGLGDEFGRGAEPRGHGQAEAGEADEHGDRDDESTQASAEVGAPAAAFGADAAPADDARTSADDEEQGHDLEEPGGGGEPGGARQRDRGHHAAVGAEHGRTHQRVEDDHHDEAGEADEVDGGVSARPARVVGREDEGGGETGVLRDAEPEDVGAAAWERAGGGPLVAGCGVVAAADGPSRVRDMGAPGTVLRSMTASKLGAGFACAHHHGVSTRGHRTDTFGCPSAHPRPYRKLTAVPAGGRRAHSCPQACAGLTAGAGGYRAVGWPGTCRLAAEAAKSEGSRLAAAEELISRERNVGFAGENCWSHAPQPTFISRKIGPMLIPRRCAAPRTPKPSAAPCRATAQHSPRGCSSERTLRRPT